MAACNDDLSPSDDSGDEDANAAGGYLLSAEEVAATQKLHAAHEARGEEIAALHSQLREKQQQLDRLQSNLARIEKEQVDDNARYDDADTKRGASGQLEVVARSLSPQLTT